MPEHEQLRTCIICGREQDKEDVAPKRCMYCGVAFDEAHKRSALNDPGYMSGFHCSGGTAVESKQLLCADMEPELYISGIRPSSHPGTSAYYVQTLHGDPLIAIDYAPSPQSQDWLLQNEQTYEAIE